MNRRGFLGRSLAAMATAVTLAPVVQAAEASEQMPTLMPGEVWVTSTYAAEQRAEGFNKGYDLGSAHEASRQAAAGAFTFEQIATACERDGHVLVRYEHGFGHQFYPGETRANGVTWIEREDGLTIGREMSDPERMALLAGWVQALHVTQPMVPRITASESNQDTLANGGWGEITMTYIPGTHHVTGMTTQVHVAADSDDGRRSLHGGDPSEAGG